MLPTRGTCHGVLLLAHAARSGIRRSFDEWISFAKDAPTFMAAALDLNAIGRAMCKFGMANLDAGSVELCRPLLLLDDTVTDEALTVIAFLLLRVNNPPWLNAAVANGKFLPEFVPSSDFKAIDWLGDNLNLFAASAVHSSEDDDAFRSWLGMVGESLIVAIERSAGSSVRHVSLISDRFGYDVESVSGRSCRLEVKTSVVGSAHRLFLTRHEVDSAVRFGCEWLLVQVILAPEALIADHVTRHHVHKVRMLNSPHLVNAMPTDSRHCRWVDTVELRTECLKWTPYTTKQIPESWVFRGARIS
jgi:hypothetical protein